MLHSCSCSYQSDKVMKLGLVILQNKENSLWWFIVAIKRETDLSHSTKMSLWEKFFFCFLQV